MKRIEKIFLLLLTAIVIQAVAVANANAKDTECMELINQLDVDQDGFISIKEAVSNTELLRRFGLIDQNEDGKLSEQELLASRFTQQVKSLQS